MTTPDDYVLIYYSGHGDNVTLEIYLKAIGYL